MKKGIIKKGILSLMLLVLLSSFIFAYPDITSVEIKPDTLYKDTELQLFTNTSSSDASNLSLHWKVYKNNNSFYSNNLAGYNWSSNSSVLAGLPLPSGSNRVQNKIFEYMGKSHIMLGQGDGLFLAYTWNGTYWNINTTLINGLTDVGAQSAPTVLEIDSELYLISGEWDGIFNGFKWNGTAWNTDSNIIRGLADMGQASAPTTHEYKNETYLIAGFEDGGLHMYTLKDRIWYYDIDASQSLPDIGNSARPQLFVDNDYLYIISGRDASTFKGFIWTDSLWEEKESLITNLAPSYSSTSPGIFQISGDLHLLNFHLSGNEGFTSDELINYSINSGLNTNYKNITLDKLEIGDELILSVKSYSATDGESGWTNSSISTIEFNESSYPRVSELFLYPETLFLDSTLQVYLNASSTDNSNLSADWILTNNGIAINESDYRDLNITANSSVDTGMSTRQYSISTTHSETNSLFSIWGLLDGTFDGSIWTGDRWYSATNLVTGLGDIGSYSAPTIFKQKGNLNLIAGENAGNFYGYTLVDGNWTINTSLVNNLPDVGSRSVPTVFELDDELYLIAGESDGSQNGFKWNGTAWNTNSAIITNLPDIGSTSKPSAFYYKENLYLFIGTSSVSIHKYIWKNDQWNNLSVLDLSDFGAVFQCAAAGAEFNNALLILGTDATDFFGLLGKYDYNLNIESDSQKLIFSRNLSELSGNDQLQMAVRAYSATDGEGEWIYSNVSTLIGPYPRIYDINITPANIYADSGMDVYANVSSSDTSDLTAFWRTYIDGNMVEYFRQNDSIIGGLGTAWGAATKYSPFYIDGRLCAFTTSVLGVLESHCWEGTSWVEDNSIKSGASTAGGSDLAIVYNDSGNVELYMMGDSTTKGFTWNGASWASNNSLMNGIPHIAFMNHAVGDVNGTKTFILAKGNANSNYENYKITYNSTDYYIMGYEWNGSDWVENLDLVNGLPIEDTFVSSMTNFIDIKGQKYLMIGRGRSPADELRIYRYEDGTWVEDNYVVSGLNQRAYYGAIAYNDQVWLLNHVSTGNADGFMADAWLNWGLTDLDYNYLYSQDLEGEYVGTEVISEIRTYTDIDGMSDWLNSTTRTIDGECTAGTCCNTTTDLYYTPQFLAGSSYICSVGSTAEYGNYCPGNASSPIADYTETIEYCGGCLECDAGNPVCQNETNLSASIISPENATWYTSPVNMLGNISACYDNTEGTYCSYQVDSDPLVNFTCQDITELQGLYNSSDTDIQLQIFAYDPTYSEVVTSSNKTYFGVDDIPPVIDNITWDILAGKNESFLVGNDTFYIKGSGYKEYISWNLNISVNDSTSGVEKVSYPTFTGGHYLCRAGGNDTTAPYSWLYAYATDWYDGFNYNPTNCWINDGIYPVTAYSNSGLNDTFYITIINDSVSPVQGAGGISFDRGQWSTKDYVEFNWDSNFTDALSGVDASSFGVGYYYGIILDGECDFVTTTFGDFVTTTNDGYENITNMTNYIRSGYCYAPYVEVRDNVDNIYRYDTEMELPTPPWDVNQSKVVKIDYKAPVEGHTGRTNTGAVYAFGTWTSDPGVDVNITCDDSISGSGCIQYAYCTDNSDTCDPTDGLEGTGWTNFSGLLPHYSPVTISLGTITDQGHTYVRYRFKDNLNQTSNLTSLSVQIDSNSPIVTITTPAADGSFFDTNSSTVIYSTIDDYPDTCWYNLTDTNESREESIPCGSALTLTGPWYEGSNTLTIFMNDTSNTTINETRTFNVDSQEPLIVVHPPSPTEGQVLETGTVNVTITDEYLLYANLVINGNPFPITLDVNGSYTGAPSWGNGEHTYYFEAFDNFRSATSTPITFKIDTIYPSLTIISPATDDLWFSSNPSISYNAIDSNLDVCDYSVNGGNYTIVSCGIDITTAVFDQGFNNISVRAKDLINHTTTKVRTLYLDSINPTGSIDYEGGLFYEANLPITYEVYDNGSGISLSNTKLQVQSSILNASDECPSFGAWSDVTGVTCTGSDTNLSCSKTYSTESKVCYNFRVYAEDEVGNDALITSINTTKLKTGGPDIDIASPINYEILAVAEDTIWSTNATDYDSFWSIISNTGSEKRVNLSVNETIDSSEMYDGHNLIAVYGNNSAGEVGFDQVEVWIDNAAPQLTLLPPSMTSGSHSSSEIMINLSITETCLKDVILELYDDTLTKIDEQAYNFNTCQEGGDYYNKTTINYYEFDELSPGTYSYKITVTDQQNLISATPIYTLYLDGDAPVINILTPAVNYQWLAYETNVLVNIQDANLYSVCTYVKNDDVQVQFTCVSGNDTLISGLTWNEGINNITISAIDNLGNNANETRFFYMDLVDPIVSYTGQTPANGSSIAGTDITINLTVVEDNIFSNRIYLLNGSGDLVDSIEAQNYTFEDIADGDYSFYARVVDLAGRSAETERRYVSIDGNLPVVTITSPTNNTITNEDLNVTYTATDLTLTACSYQLNNLSINPTVCNLPITGISWPEGENSLVVYAEDSYSNVGSSQLTVIKDTVTPTVTVYAPSINNDSIFAGQSEVLFNVLFEDDNLDIIEISCYDDINLSNNLLYTKIVDNINGITSYPITDVGTFSDSGVKYCRASASDSVNTERVYFNFDITPAQELTVTGEDLITGDAVTMDLSVNVSGIVTEYSGMSAYDLTVPCSGTTITACSANHVNCDIKEISSCGEPDYTAYFWESQINLEAINPVSGNLISNVDFTVRINTITYNNDTNNGQFSVKERSGNYIIDATKDHYQSVHLEGILSFKENKTIQIEMNPIYDVFFYREETGAPFDFTELNESYACENGTTTEIRTDTIIYPDDYTCVGNFSTTHPCENGIDADDSTYAVADLNETASIELSYIKPGEALNSSYIEFRRDILTDLNVSMEDHADCWSYNANNLYFKFESNESSSEMQLYCKNSAGWKSLMNVSNGGYIWSQEMNWQYQYEVPDYSNCSDIVYMDFKFKAFCENKIISETITQYNQEIEIDCPYSYWMITADYSTETYYRTLIPDKDEVIQEVYMLDLKDDVAIETSLQINDVANEYSESGIIKIYKDIGINNKVVIEQNLDIENKVTLWLDQNQVYKVCAINNEGVESCHGILTADESGEKILTLPNIPLDYDGQYVGRDLYWTVLPSKEAGVVKFNYYDYTSSDTESVTFTITNADTNQVVYEETVDATKLFSLEATGLSEYSSYWYDVEVNHGLYSAPREESKSLWVKSATNFPGFSEWNEHIKFVVAILVPIILLFIFSLASLEWGMSIAVAVMWSFHALSWYDLLKDKIAGGTGWVLTILILFTLLTVMSWITRTNRVE